jgi:hypothetical protein
MKIERAQYEAWHQRWSEIHDTVTDQKEDWVSSIAGFAYQIESSRHDTYLIGLARTAKRLASEFKKPKRGVLPSDAYQSFLNAWVRVEGAINMHLLDRPPT